MIRSRAARRRGATWNPADKDPGITLSAGNLQATSSGPGQDVRSTRAAGGKRYFELTMIGTTKIAIGFGNLSKPLSGLAYSSTEAVGYYSDGGVGYGGGAIASYATFTDGDVVNCAIDMAAGPTVWFGKNGAWNGDPAAGTGGLSVPGLGATVFAMFFSENGGAGLAAFGPAGLAYAPPGGFVGLGA